MKEIDFVELLHLPSYDEKVEAMLKTLGAPKPIIDKRFKEDSGNSIVVRDPGVELFFSDSSKSKDKEIVDLYPPGTIIFGAALIFWHTELVVPFGLEMTDSYDDIVKKIGKPTYSTEYVDQKIWLFTRNDGIKYLVYVMFKSDDFSEIASVRISGYFPKIEALRIIKP